jgi:hypothetical protein
MGMYLQKKRTPAVYDLFIAEVREFADAPRFTVPTGSLVGHLFMNLNGWRSWRGAKAGVDRQTL